MNYEQNTKVHHSNKAIRFGDHSPANLIFCGGLRRTERREREILIPKKEKINKHETLGQALELCHKLRPVHYHYGFYHY